MQEPTQQRIFRPANGQAYFAGRPRDEPERIPVRTEWLRLSQEIRSRYLGPDDARAQVGQDAPCHGCRFCGQVDDPKTLEQLVTFASHGHFAPIELRFAQTDVTRSEPMHAESTVSSAAPVLASLLVTGQDFSFSQIRREGFSREGRAVVVPLGHLATQSA